MKRYRALLVGAAIVVALACVFLFPRQEVGTRVVCTGGQACTEYFSLKDGLPLRAVCPSDGREQYGLGPGCTRLGNDCRCP